MGCPHPASTEDHCAEAADDQPDGRACNRLYDPARANESIRVRRDGGIYDTESILPPNVCYGDAAQVAFEKPVNRVTHPPHVGALQLPIQEVDRSPRFVDGGL